MNDLTTLNSLLSGLAADLQLPGLVLDEFGVCHFELEGGLVVTVYHHEEAGRTSLYANVGTIGDDVPVDLLTLMLQANLAPSDMRGSVIGLDPDAENALLCRSIDLRQLSKDDFRNLVNDFVEVARQWIKVIPEMVQGGVVEKVDEPLPPVSAAMRV